MKLPAPKGELKLESVTVVPPQGKVPTVKGVSMFIPAGTTVGLIGPSASGKSTLARAMLGVWPLAAGKVRLDGADIHQWNSTDLGPYIGYLPQDIELFEGTISENISRFGELDADAVVEAAKLAGVHEMILKLPNGYDTVVGAGGSTLSGGQRQRIGLARAIYKLPTLIVLDEPNSNLDDEGEKALLNAILELKKQHCTVVLITHKTNILAAVDNIAVMRGGVLTMYDEKNKVFQALQQQAQAAAKPASAQQAAQPAQPSSQAATTVKMGQPKMSKPGEKK
jgi:ATP-binding cassette subfamily C protein EexD